MKKKLLLQDFSDALVRNEGISKKEADTFVRAFFEVVEQGLLEDKYVKIKGFGTFKLVAVSERESVNINTGERFQISGHTKVSFTPDATMKELVNRPFAHFETVDLSEDTDTSEFDSIDEAALAEEEDEELDETMDANGEGQAEGITAEAANESASETFDEPAAEPTPEVPNPEVPTEEDEEEEVNASLPKPINHDMGHVASTTAPTTAEGTIKKVSLNEESEPSTSEPSNADAPVEAVTPTTPQLDADRHEQQEEEIVVTPPRTITPHSEFENNTMSYTYHEVPTKKKRNRWKTAFLILGMILIVFISYFAGYYRVLCPCSYPFIEQLVHPTLHVSTAGSQATGRPASDSIPQNSSTGVSAQADGAKEAAAQEETAKAKAEAEAKAAAEKAAAEKAAAQAKAKAEAAIQPRTHTVRKGDNLSKISRQYYGSDKYVQAIIKHNNLKDANNIPPGMKLQLP